MDLVKALLVFFAISGCAEVASQLPLTHRAPLAAAQGPARALDIARLGPPTPIGAGARRVDRAATKSTAVAQY
jgi:hypothetical protein